MVSQYLNARRPLRLAAAIKFANGLGVKVFDISPTLAGQLPKDAQSSMADQAPSPAVSALPAINNEATIDRLMAGLADYLVQMDDYARDNAADVLQRLTRKPEEHARAAALFATAFQSGKRKAA